MNVTAFKRCYLRHKILIKVVCSIVLLCLVLHFSQTNHFWETYRDLKYYPLLLCIVCAPMLYFLEAWRWHILLKNSGSALSLFDILKINLASQVSAVALPGQTGSDLVRFLGIHSHGVTKAKTLYVIVLAKLSYLLAVISVCVACILTSNVFLNPELIGTLSIGALLLLLAFFLSYTRLFAGFTKKIGLHIENDQTPFISIILVVALSTLSHLMNCVLFFLLLDSAVIPISFPNAALLSSLLVLSQAIPLTYLGLGLKEGVIAMSFQKLHLASGAGIAISLFGTFFFILISTGYFLVAEGYSSFRKWRVKRFSEKTFFVE